MASTRLTTLVVGSGVAANSIWAVLHREGHRLFPDEMFADLFSVRGRRSVPPQVVATVMVNRPGFGGGSFVWFCWLTVGACPG